MYVGRMKLLYRQGKKKILIMISILVLSAYLTFKMTARQDICTSLPSVKRCKRLMIEEILTESERAI